MKKDTTALFLVYLVFFFGMVGYSMTIVVFTPLVLGEASLLVGEGLSLAARSTLLGFLLFLYPFGQFCSSPILGALSDRFGRRPFLASSIGIMAAAYLFIALFVKESWLYPLMGALFLAGLTAGNVVIAFGVVTDLIKLESRNRYFGYVYLARALAFIIGPLLGGKLTHFGNATSFWVICVLLVIVFLWTLFSFRETHGEEHREKIHLFQAFTNLRSIFTHQKVRKLFLVNFLIYLAIYGFFRCYPMYLVDRFHLGASKLSEYIAWLSVPIILMSLFVLGWLSKKLTTVQICVLGAFLTGITLLISILPNTLNAQWVPLFFVGVGFALCLPSTNALLSASVSQKEQGRVLGNNQSLQVFGEASSALFGGFLAAIFIKLSIITFGIISFVAALLLLLFHRHRLG